MAEKYFIDFTPKLAQHGLQKKNNHISNTLTEYIFFQIKLFQNAISGIIKEMREKRCTWIYEADNLSKYKYKDKKLSVNYNNSTCAVFDDCFTSTCHV